MSRKTVLYKQSSEHNNVNQEFLVLLEIKKRLLTRSPRERMMKTYLLIRRLVTWKCPFRFFFFVDSLFQNRIEKIQNINPMVKFALLNYEINATLTILICLTYLSIVPSLDGLEFLQKITLVASFQSFDQSFAIRRLNWV